MLALGAMRRVLGSLIVACACLGGGEVRAAGGRPPLFLWAWERNEDLRFLGTRDVGVAFLAETLRLDGETVKRVPRRQPLRVAPNARLCAVIRVESSRRRPATFTAAQVAAITSAFAQAAALPGVREVQIDFDARASQRPAYRRLLADIRAALPRGTGFSMTALASWCTFDRWLDEAPLPVDEVVPMAFAMGPEGGRILAEIDAAGDFRSPSCRAGLGVSTHGPRPALPRSRRTWVFNDKPWDEAAFLELPWSGGRP